MTCEVAVMNKYALVIAADSAVTTSSDNGAERYSKGGNKIFQLSRVEPVGLMIYGSAMLDGVPWEIIIKNFRDKLGSTKYGNLQEYATSFFDFVKKAAYFFSPADLDSKFVSHVLTIAINFVKEGIETRTVINDPSNALELRVAEWQAFLNEKTAQLVNLPLHAEISPAALQEGIDQINQTLQNDPSFASYLAEVKIADVISTNELFVLSCTYFFKAFAQVLGRTGIVFSGFGTDQYFPTVIQYDVFGFVRNDFLFSKDSNNSCEISHKKPSGIFQFAMTSSIDTFTTGVGLDTYTEVHKAYRTSSQTLVTKMLAENNIVNLPANFEATIQASCEEFSKDWFNKMLAVHYHPMKRVIASLPIQEMVHLAETLIVLQSLKERITTHSESVGGPVDIAVITKAEGLVWIKRKHYFDSDKNLPYVMRQKALYEENP